MTTLSTAMANGKSAAVSPEVLIDLKGMSRVAWATDLFRASEPFATGSAYVKFMPEDAVVIPAHLADGMAGKTVEMTALS